MPKGEILELCGVVLSARPSRDYDKCLTLLTKELGKITVWASGAKKPGSPLMAACRPFVFGSFQLAKGRSGYNLRSASIARYFTEIALDLTNACYGSYFLEFSDYCAQEGLPSEEMVSLLYLSLCALLKENIPNELVRRIFELRMLFLNGEYTELPPGHAGKGCEMAWRHVLDSPLQKLYTFLLSQEQFREFSENVDALLLETIPKHFKSLAVLETIR